MTYHHAGTSCVFQLSTRHSMASGKERIFSDDSRNLNRGNEFSLATQSIWILVDSYARATVKEMCWFGAAKLRKRHLTIGGGLLHWCPIPVSHGHTWKNFQSTAFETPRLDQLKAVVVLLQGSMERALSSLGISHKSRVSTMIFYFRFCHQK